MDEHDDDVLTLSGHSGHSLSVNCIIQLPDGHIVSCSRDKTIKTWDYVSGKCEQTLVGHTDSVTSIILLADGRLASGSQDKSIKVWNIDSGECVKTGGVSRLRYCR